MTKKEKTYETRYFQTIKKSKKRRCENRLRLPFFGTSKDAVPYRKYNDDRAEPARSFHSFCRTKKGGPRRARSMRWRFTARGKSITFGGGFRRRTHN